MFIGIILFVTLTGCAFTDMWFSVNRELRFNCSDTSCRFGMSFVFKWPKSDDLFSAICWGLCFSMKVEVFWIRASNSWVGKSRIADEYLLFYSSFMCGSSMSREISNGFSTSIIGGGVGDKYLLFSSFTFGFFLEHIHTHPNKLNVRSLLEVSIETLD